MDYFNIYLENLPNLFYGLVCTIPTITYFASVKFYLRFHKKDKLPDKKYIESSTKNIISSSFANIFISYPLFSYFSEIEHTSIFMILSGCLLIDTVEYWTHNFFHKTDYIYKSFHDKHHLPYPINPMSSFSNHDLAINTVAPIEVILFLIFNFTFLEYIIIISLAFCATVCDHTFTSPKKFHVLHHSGEKKTNLQQPFFTFWDHINGTYNKKSLLKIPFVP
jgi:sterol desaturase/sphingolipid hydroxylase (fatty acid hydroxylase superfamily)